MKTTLLSLLAAIVFVASAYAQMDAILTITPGGHKAMIKDIAVTNDGRYILSASNDKTIKIWDARTGEIKDEILGQIGEGSDGKIYAMALSPDNKYLAVGGYLLEPDGYSTHIRLYDFPRRKLIGLLKGYSNVVFALAFSNDSKYLVSGSSDKTVRVWSVKEQRRVKTFSGHTNDVYGVAMYGEKIVSASYDKTVKLWSLDEDVPLKTSTLHIKEAKRVAFSPDGRLIASGGKDNKLILYDNNLNQIQTIDNQTRPSSISFSPDGKKIVCGYSTGQHKCNLYELQKGTWRRVASFEGHKNTVLATAFLDNTTAITGGGDDKEICFWSWSGGTTKLLRTLAGKGKPVWAVGIAGKSIAYTNVWTANKGRSQLTQQFQLFTREHSSLVHSALYAKPLTEFLSYSLSHSAGGDYGYDNAVLTIKKNGVTTGAITRGSTDGFGHNVYSFTPDLKVISGGSNGFLTAYDIEGKKLTDFIGHTGEVWGIAVSQDGKRLVSGSGDQTINLWNLEGVGKNKTITPIVSLFIATDGEWVMWHPSGYYDASAGGEQYIGWHVNRGAEQNADFYPSSYFRKQFYNPKLITKLLETGDMESAKQALAVTTSYSISSLSPPKVQWLVPESYAASSTQSAYTISAKIISAKDVLETKVLVNGRTAGERGMKPIASGTTFTQTITLESGENEVAIFVKNADAEIVSEKRIIMYEQVKKQADVFKPNLYFLSIGVSQYQNNDLNLSYADKDASALSELFQKQKGELFNEVNIQLLTNAAATQRGIKKSLSKLRQEATQRDFVIVSVAAHGVNDADNTFFLLSHDTEVDDISATGVKYSDITDVLGNLPCKVLVFLDACHSGNFAKEGVKTRDYTSSMSEIIRELTSEDKGVVVMAAATGKEVSIESSEWNHGAFTKALLDGLSSKADYDNDGIIYTNELDLFVTNRVKELTKGKQHPTTYKPSSVPSFPIFRVKK
jgi:WD40 repeat protein